MNLLIRAFTTPYCQMTALDSATAALPLLGVFCIAFLINRIYRKRP
jgi:hypothetical protein